MGCNSSKEGLPTVLNVEPVHQISNEPVHIFLPLKDEDSCRYVNHLQGESNHFFRSVQESEQNNEKVVSDEAETAAAIKIQAAYRGHKVRMDLRKGDDNTTNLLPESEAELEELTNAATKIQASFRGHLTRKNQKGNDQEALTKELKRLDTKESEELDIDLTDPDLNKAATKIQASFRGHKARREGPEVTPTKTNPVLAKDAKLKK